MTTLTPKYETLLLQIADDGENAGIATCTFNRPEKRNALNQAMVDEIHSALRLLKENSSVRVLIFTGAGDKSFISGADIAELKGRDRFDALSQINSGLFREIESFPLPTIAAINGFALGGGMELALACDIRICCETAKMGQPEVGLGIIPGAGGCYRLPRVVGLGIAKELVFTGKIVDAAAAERLGIVNRSVPCRDLMKEANAIAQSIARNGSLALRLAKASIHSEYQPGFGLALERASQAILFEDKDKHRRMAEFLDKKAAKKRKV